MNKPVEYPPPVLQPHVQPTLISGLRRSWEEPSPTDVKQEVKKSDLVKPKATYRILRRIPKK